MGATFTRLPVALKKVPTSCSCGGTEAWTLVCLVLDEEMVLGPQMQRGHAELMLGCTCHSTVEDIADTITRTCGGDLMIEGAYMHTRSG